MGQGFDGFDAYRPAEIAERIERVGVVKAALPLGQLLTLAILAGAFIGFGAAAYLKVMVGVDLGFGPARALGGFVFALGLILVIVGGAELFTGNALMIMAAVDRRIGLAALLRNWGVVYLGNAVGAAGLALAFALSGLVQGDLAALAVRVAESKLSLTPLEAFMRGVLCNALVCLAVWLSFAGRSAADKILAVLWPVAAFVLLGLEHSVANMFFLPLGFWAGAEGSVSAALASLSWVSLGNLIGGAGGVALAYRWAYLGPRG